MIWILKKNVLKKWGLQSSWKMEWMPWKKVITSLHLGSWNEISKECEIVKFMFGLYPSVLIYEPVLSQPRFILKFSRSVEEVCLSMFVVTVKNNFRDWKNFVFRSDSFLDRGIYTVSNMLSVSILQQATADYL